MPFQVTFSKIVVFFEGGVPPLTILPEGGGVEGGTPNPEYKYPLLQESTAFEPFSHKIYETDINVPPPSPLTGGTPPEAGTPPPERKRIKVSHLLFALGSVESKEAKEEKKEEEEGVPLVLKCLAAPLVPMDASDMDNKGGYPEIEIAKAEPKAGLSCTYAPPGLVGDTLKLTILTKANGDVLKNASLSLLLAAPSPPPPPGSPKNERKDANKPGLVPLDEGSSSLGLKFSVTGAEEIKGDDDAITSVYTIPHLQADGSHTLTVLAEAKMPIGGAPGGGAAPMGRGGCELVAQLRYRVDGGEGEEVMVSSQFKIWFVKALGGIVRLFPEEMPKIPKIKPELSGPLVVRAKPFIIHANLENTSPHDLEMKSVWWDFTSAPELRVTSVMPIIEYEPDKIKQQEEEEKEIKKAADGCVEASLHLGLLRPHEKQTKTFALKAQATGIAKGAYLKATWRRRDWETAGDALDMGWRQTKVGIPAFACVETSFIVKRTVPERCLVRSTVAMRLDVTNTTNEPQKIEVNMVTPANSDALAVCGPTSTSFEIEPHGSHTLRCSLTARKCGPLPLPKIQLYSKRFAKFIYDKNDLGTIFVSPVPIPNPNPSPNPNASPNPSPNASPNPNPAASAESERKQGGGGVPHLVAKQQQQQQEGKNSGFGIEVPTSEVPTSEVPTTQVPTTQVPTTESAAAAAAAAAPGETNGGEASI
eukprot:CAMPEP_0167796006 /NCGR_PEP_ID=MMETSP0111_2-20121227/14793_1 /TAXON_ID=91324 /ORGANISM="Lotharella globosa, Strain CCCM811" /LENGTH=702 /DNA_ID=CAMNT_0007689821 /DNA_START=61 /DNA_END=2169 /DNA_ORIENTATION=-